MPLNDLVLPVLDKRIAWVVVEELGDWSVQRNRITGHFRLVNTRERLRYRSSRDLGEVMREFRARFSGRTGGATLPNVAMPTLGGRVFWDDVHVDESGWRIQRNRLTGHLRLLDRKDCRRAWGFDAGALLGALDQLAAPVEREPAPEDFVWEGGDDPEVMRRLRAEIRRLGLEQA